MNFDPAHNVWRAEDGRLWSSISKGLVEATDPGTTAWLASGRVASTWPRDADGVQTQAALDEVLAFYNIGLPLGSAPTLTTKLDLYRRMTDDEAEAVEVALAGAKVRDRRMFEEAQILSHADQDFARLRETLVGMFGEPRAAELLAPSAVA